MHQIAYHALKQIGTP